MPQRKNNLVENEIYHVFNRSIAKIPIFHTKRNSDRFLGILDYYRFTKPPIRFSYFTRQSQIKRSEILDQLYLTNKTDVEIFAFCIMQNHFHLLVKQKSLNGISKYLKLIQESYAKYFNLISERTGSVFQQAFKAIHIEDGSQFTHVARYIHLNPLTSFIIKSPESLRSFQLTSFLDYVSEKPRPFLNTQLLLSLYPSKEKFTEHTLDQLDYQRHLNQIKHHMPGM